MLQSQEPKGKVRMLQVKKNDVSQRGHEFNLPHFGNSHQFRIDFCISLHNRPTNSKFNKSLLPYLLLGTLQNQKIYCLTLGTKTSFKNLESVKQAPKFYIKTSGVGC